MADEQHPGKIIYIDGNTGQVVNELPVEQVPPDLRFARTNEGKVPVVKVVATVAGNQRFIREFGPDGQLLRSTVQVAKR